MTRVAEAPATINATFVTRMRKAGLWRWGWPSFAVVPMQSRLLATCPPLLRLVPSGRCDDTVQDCRRR